MFHISCYQNNRTAHALQAFFRYFRLSRTGSALWRLAVPDPGFLLWRFWSACLGAGAHGDFGALCLSAAGTMRTSAVPVLLRGEARAWEEEDYSGNRTATNITLNSKTYYVLYETLQCRMASKMTSGNDRLSCLLLVLVSQVSCSWLALLAWLGLSHACVWIIC